jgi:hypothetical protein
MNEGTADELRLTHDRLCRSLFWAIRLCDSQSPPIGAVTVTKSPETLVTNPVAAAVIESI